MGHFILNQKDRGIFSFSLLSDNNSVLLESESYDSKDAAENGIESMRTIASFSSRFNQMRTEDNHHYFLLMAANDQIMGKSKLYDSIEAMEVGIEEVMQCAGQANVVFV